MWLHPGLWPYTHVPIQPKGRSGASARRNGFLLCARGCLRLCQALGLRRGLARGVRGCLLGLPLPLLTGAEDGGGGGGAGAAIGAVVAVLALVGGALLVVRRRRRRAASLESRQSEDVRWSVSGSRKADLVEMPRSPPVKGGGAQTGGGSGGGGAAEHVEELERRVSSIPISALGLFKGTFGGSMSSLRISSAQGGAPPPPRRERDRSSLLESQDVLTPTTHQF